MFHIVYGENELLKKREIFPFLTELKMSTFTSSPKEGEKREKFVFVLENV